MTRKLCPNKRSAGLGLFRLVVEPVVALTCIVMFLCLGGQCISRFTLGETRAVLGQVRSNETAFPEVTVCPDYNAAFNDTALALLGLDKVKYRAGKFWTPLASNLSVRSVFDLVTFDLSSVVSGLQVAVADATLTVDSKNMTKLINVTARFDKSYGKCFTLHFQPWLVSRTIRQLTVYEKRDIYLFIHHAGQFLTAGAKFKVNGKLGSRVFLDVDLELTERTAWSNSGKDTCYKQADETYDDVLVHRSNSAIVESLNCSLPFPSYSDEVCADGARALDMYWVLMISVQLMSDAVPCTTLKVTPALPTYDEDPGKNNSYIKFYMPIDVDLKTIIRDYSLLSMLAEVGSYAGITLGISILKLNDVIKQLSIMTD